MYSITSIFAKENIDLWESLEAACEFGGLQKAAIPHFSWQTAESYEFEAVRKELALLAEAVPSFTFKTSGIGIFRNNRKIFFLIIVKDRNLLDLHEMIWKRTINFAIKPNLHYSPENWIPHITLNLNELSEDQFKCSVEELTSKPLNFSFEVNQFGLLFLNPTESGVDSLYPLHKTGNGK